MFLTMIDYSLFAPAISMFARRQLSAASKPEKLHCICIALAFAIFELILGTQMGGVGAALQTYAYVSQDVFKALAIIIMPTFYAGVMVYFYFVRSLKMYYIEQGLDPEVKISLIVEPLKRDEVLKEVPTSQVSDPAVKLLLHDEAVE